ncbi:glycosyltransferase family 39 protein [Mucisphaera sp.]|uniref:glycosyltransferase family 39 protein n=1 Tax=Mucisphaera sp. TaxID=2913024 RepID=UPI003D122E34
MSDAQAPNPKHLRTLAILLLLGLTFLATLAVSSTLWDRDEARFARAAVEMLESDDYLVPTFNDNIRPDKPAGIYWAMVAGIQLLGETEIAVRLPSIFGLLWAATATYFAAFWITNQKRAAVIAFIILLTAIMPIVMGTLSTADGLLLGCLTQAYATFVHRAVRGPAWWHPPMLLLALTAGQLTKGPIGLAIPMANIILAGWLIGRAQRDDWRLGKRFWLSLWIIAALSFAAFLAWAIPANTQSQGVLLDIGLGTHVLDRMVTPQEGHGGSNTLEYLALIPFYVPVLLIGLLPWTAIFPSAFNALRRREFLNGRDRALIWAWLIPTFITMSLVATKLPHYILPIFPGLAVLIGAFVNQTAQKPPRADTRFARAGRAIFFLLIASLGLTLLIAPYALSLTDLAWRTALPAAILLLGIPWVLINLAQRRLLEITSIFATVTPIFILISASTLLPWVEHRLKISPEIAEAIKLKLPEEATIYTLGYREPSVIYYLSRPLGYPVQRMQRTREALLAWAASPRPTRQALIISTKEAQRLNVTPEDLGVISAGSKDFWNYSSDDEGRALTIEVWILPSNAPKHPANHNATNP